MPETSARHGKSFDANIDILFDELLLAAKWGRPSVLLAVHKSKFGQEKAERALAARLTQQGQDVIRLVVNDRRADVIGQMRSAPLHDKPVFFISNIDWGGGEDASRTYQVLNMQREFFVEHSIRAVFWLTTNEARRLPRLAPDFWAFRHRVVEFVSQRAPTRLPLPAGALGWDIQKSVDPFEDLQGGIRAREDLLARLPRNMEALSTRVELHYHLGYLHWEAAETALSSKSLKAGLDLMKDYELPDLRARLLNGMGILDYEAGKFTEALDRFNAGLRSEPRSGVILTNIAAADSMLGRNQQAVAACRKALRLHESDAGCWSRCGYIYAGMGKPDEAITCMKKAAELAPRAAAHQLGLAVFASLVDRPDEARGYVERAMELPGTTEPYVGILQEAVLGDAVQAGKMLRAAVQAGKISKADLRRDPNLAILFGPAARETPA